MLKVTQMNPFLNLVIPVAFSKKTTEKFMTPQGIDQCLKKTLIMDSKPYKRIIRQIPYGKVRLEKETLVTVPFPLLYVFFLSFN
mgnify:CR=1 FL=1